jgi:hypothetical protein
MRAIVKIKSDVVLNLGFGFKILEMDALGMHKLDAGIVVKGIARAGTLAKPLRINGSVLLSSLDNMDALTSKLSAQIVAGFGFDIGLAYNWSIFGGKFGELAAGLVGDDVYSPAFEVVNISGAGGFSTIPASGNSYIVPFRVNAGLAYTAPKFLGDILVITVMADYEDATRIFNPKAAIKNPALGASIGMEVSVIKIIKVRAGIRDALPALGLGVDLAFFEIETALYGLELNKNEPGTRAWGVDIALSIRPDFKPKQASWNKKPLVNSLLEKAKKDPAPANNSNSTSSSVPADNVSSNSAYSMVDDFR